MRAYEIEACAAALERAKGHARAARLDGHIISEIDHALATVRANADEN